MQWESGRNQNEKPKKSANERLKHKPSNGNRRQIKLEEEIKKLRKRIARAGNKV